MEKPVYFSNEDKYDDLIKKYKAMYDKQYGIEVGVNNIKGVIAQESMFDPYAKRWEKKVNDYSYGLMQVLGSTARLLGWDGRENLLEPDVNLKYGIKHFYNLFKKYKKYTDVYAAYNAGDVKRDQFGKYINQYYVDIVSAFASFYYYRDVKKDYEMAMLYKKRIQEMRAEERKRELGLESSETDYTTLVIFVVIIGVIIYLITKKA